MHNNKFEFNNAKTGACIYMNYIAPFNTSIFSNLTF